MRERTKAVGLAILALLVAAAAGAETVRGRIVAVSPEARTITMRVPLADGEALDRTFRTDDLTRIRGSEGILAFEDLGIGDTAAVTYARTEGRSVARVIDVEDEPVVVPSFGIEAAEVVSLEDREQYEERIRSTLEVLEEEIEDLAQPPETGSPEELDRRRALVEAARDQMTEAWDVFWALEGTSGDLAWADARVEMQAALTELRAAVSVAQDVIAGR